MRAPGAEVRSCPRCRVTAPAEYRRCVHCGARLVAGPLHPGMRGVVPASGNELPGEVVESAGGEAVPEEEAPRSLLGRIPWFWVLLLLIPLLRRACAPE